MKKCVLIMASFLMSLASYAGGDGPVASVCKSDIEKFCSDKQHVAKETKLLETKKAEIWKRMLQVLENTGPGSGMGKGRKK